MKAEKEKERLLDELDFQRVDCATQGAKKMGDVSVKELRSVAKQLNIKGRSKAKSKADLVQLLEKEYGDIRRRATKPTEDEITRWERQIIEEEHT